MAVVQSLVSIIIPVHNRAAMLREAVDSALAQTHRPLEILIVDDGSTDDTPRVADELAARHEEVTAIHQPNGGPGVAREAGRQAARGEYIQYLDSDDLLLPRKLELQVAALERDASCGVAYGMARYVDVEGREYACTWKDPHQVQAAMLPSFLTGRWWDTGAPLYRRSVTDAAGPWTALRLEEDWEYDTRVGALGTRLTFVPEVIVVIRDPPDARLSRGDALDPARLRDRARAHELIYRHARRAGIGDDVPEMKRFARELFLLARQCGAAGLRDESQLLFALSRQASGAEGDRAQFRAYAAATRVLGWQLTGRLACFSDRWRS